MYMVKKQIKLKTSLLEERGWQKVDANVYRIILKNPKLYAFYSPYTLEIFSPSLNAIKSFCKKHNIKRINIERISEMSDDDRAKFTALFSFEEVIE